MGSSTSTPDLIEDCDEIQDWFKNPDDLVKQRIAFIKRDHIMYGKYNTDNIINYAVKLGWIMDVKTMNMKKINLFIEKIKEYLIDNNLPNYNIKDMWYNFDIPEQHCNIIDGYVIINHNWNELTANSIDEFFNACNKHELDTLGW
tara:strand:+ start:299 stop:733 length:435 start_codon:yes stop_codon:yes gene_type:complete